LPEAPGDAPQESQPAAGAAAETFLAALRAADAARARRLWRRQPALATASSHAACALGEADLVAGALAAHPRLAVAPHEAAAEWTALLYLCASPFHASSPARAAGIRRCAEALLDAGADPNSSTSVDLDHPEARLSALYYACVNDSVEVVRLLLARGADPNDGESVYHAAEMDHRDCLELLRAAGAELSQPHPVWQNTPLYFLAGYGEQDRRCARVTAGMRWLLEHGADPNMASSDRAETPLHRVVLSGRSTEVAELLLDHGAALDTRRADGRTAYVLAVRAGQTALADFLRGKGAATAGAEPRDVFAGACMEADRDRVGALLADHPDLLANLAEEDRQLLAAAAGEGRTASVRLMVELGFDLAWEGEHGGTALHHAAWRGNSALVRELLALGAPLDVRDRQFGSSPLGWAAHGSRHCRSADDDYCAVAEALLDASSSLVAATNRWNEPPEALASRRVAALLRRRGRQPRPEEP
jgi:ankyrin repeat protein